MTRIAENVPLPATRFGFVELLRKLVRQIVRADELRRQRLALRQLDDRLLRDIGIDGLDAMMEARRPFWDIAGREER